VLFTEARRQLACLFYRLIGWFYSFARPELTLYDAGVAYKKNIKSPSCLSQLNFQLNG